MASWLAQIQKSSDLGSDVWTLLALVVGVALLHKVFFGRKKLRLPPGPRGWPVLGNLPILGTMPHLSITELSKKYGPLMSIRLGSASAVVISSPEMAKVFFRTQDHIFANRPFTINGQVFMYNFQDVSFSPYNEHWRFLRKVIDMEIFSNKRLRHLKDFRGEEILASIERMLEEGRGGNPVDMKKSMAQLSVEHICRICFNNNYSQWKSKSCHSNGVPKTLASMLDEWIAISGAFFVGEYIPYLRKLDLGGFEAQLLRLRSDFEQFLNPIIEEHRKNEGRSDKDFLDVLLSLQRENQDGFPNDRVKALINNVLIAGTQTTSDQTTWALTELMRHPDIKQKVVDELDLVVGRERLVEESDIGNLVYLKAVVKETLRMYPSVPLGVPHEAMEDTQVAGHDIPKKTRVLFNAYGIGRDPKLWEDPTTFNPERFINSPIDVKGHHFELLSFGAGRRQCPGMDMGLLLVQVTVAQILHTCHLSVPAGVVVDVEEGIGITLPKANPLMVLISPRLEPQFYIQKGIKVNFS
ncbi:hypothetical protein AXG93_1390s1250 [Marchantia polymorpha subsp. ruderalis]|nr:hypothetical protein AXG93_1390s1250 [Marchantia polymorpha subsp. ruderalis]